MLRNFVVLLSNYSCSSPSPSRPLRYLGSSDLALLPTLGEAAIMSDLGEAPTSTPNNPPPAPQDVVQQQAQAAAIQQPGTPAQSTAPAVNSAGENLQCQWQGCGERCTSPEALYVSTLILMRSIELWLTIYRNMSASAMSVVSQPTTST